MTIPCTEKDKIDDMHADIKDIKTAILGDGKSVGLVTKVALNKQSIGRVWWWVGMISVAIIAVAMYIIRGKFG